MSYQDLVMTNNQERELFVKTKTSLELDVSAVSSIYLLNIRLTVFLRDLFMLAISVTGKGH